MRGRIFLLLITRDEYRKIQDELESLIPLLGSHIYNGYNTKHNNF